MPRERLRWGNERRAAALKGVSPQEGDSVEMWCEGVHVPGAWLEAVVHTVKNGRLYLGEVSIFNLSLGGRGGRNGGKGGGGRPWSVKIGVKLGGRSVLPSRLSLVCMLRRPCWASAVYARGAYDSTRLGSAHRNCSISVVDGLRSRRPVHGENRSGSGIWSGQ